MKATRLYSLPSHSTISKRLKRYSLISSFWTSSLKVDENLNPCALKARTCQTARRPDGARVVVVRLAVFLVPAFSDYTFHHVLGGLPVKCWWAWNEHFGQQFLDSPNVIGEGS